MANKERDTTTEAYILHMPWLFLYYFVVIKPIFMIYYIWILRYAITPLNLLLFSTPA